MPHWPVLQETKNANFLVPYPWLPNFLCLKASPRHPGTILKTVMLSSQPFPGYKRTNKHTGTQTHVSIQLTSNSRISPTDNCFSVVWQEPIKSWLSRQTSYYGYISHITDIQQRHNSAYVTRQTFRDFIRNRSKHNQWHTSVSINRKCIVRALHKPAVTVPVKTFNAYWPKTSIIHVQNINHTRTSHYNAQLSYNIYPHSATTWHCLKLQH